MKYLLTALILAAGAAQAQQYPTKAIRFFVGYTPGGLADTFARVMSADVQKSLGQPIVIENRPGASQVIALDAAAKAPPDGYTWAYGTQSGMVFTTASKKSLPYDPLKDFAAISMLFQTPLYLVVHPSVPAQTMKELIAYAKANPGKLSFASIGQGSTQHLAMEMFLSRTGVKMLHVPYKGSAPASTDLVAGRVQVMFEGPTSSAPHIKAGKLRALATSGSERTEAFRNVPTVIESGLPGFDMASWFGVQTVAGTPRPIIDRVNKEVVAWLKSGEAAKLAAKFDLDLTPSTPEQMAERIRREIPEFTKLMRAVGIEPE